MKKVIITFLICSVFAGISAQNYTQVFDSISAYSSVVIGWPHSNNNVNVKTERTSYHPILTGNVCRWSVPRMDLSGCWLDTIWAIKDDTNGYSLIISRSAYNSYSEYGQLYASADNEKLYYVNSETNESLLIMDLSLSVGDTFATKGTYEEDVIMVVDSVYYDNNKKHIQFDRDLWTIPSQVPPVKCCFIEGVGPNWGFSIAEENAPLLICKHEDDELYYCYPDTTFFKDCNFREPCFGDAVFTYDPKCINVFPNPTSDKIVIESDFDISHIVVFDMFGKVLQKTTPPIGRRTHVIDMASYTNGVYFVQCDMRNRKINAKIIKN